MPGGPSADPRMPSPPTPFPSHVRSIELKTSSTYAPLYVDPTSASSAYGSEVSYNDVEGLDLYENLDQSHDMMLSYSPTPVPIAFASSTVSSHPQCSSFSMVAKIDGSCESQDHPAIPDYVSQAMPDNAAPAILRHGTFTMH